MVSSNWDWWITEDSPNSPALWYWDFEAVQLNFAAGYYSKLIYACLSWNSVNIFQRVIPGTSHAAKT